MGTEVALSFSALRAQLENEKSSLFKIDENIKKIVQTGSGRFPNDRFNPAGEYARGGNRVGGRNSFPEGGNNYSKVDEHFGKRKQETKTVFSRLSAKIHDSDGEEEITISGPAPVVKRVKMTSAVSRELPTRAAVLRAQGGDEQARTRNRRMFGSLLGTLQKFKQEEIVLQTKEEKKAQVERKIEEAARLEKEREQKERKTLFAEREHKKATIKALEAKMARVAEFERWETSQKHLGNFILTKAKPHVYWLPKKMNEKADEKLTSSRKFHEKYMSKKREELQDELQRIENRVLRLRGPGAKENKPAFDNNQSLDSQHCLDDSQLGLDDSHNQETNQEDGSKKRDKFAMEVDKDESDDDRHDEMEVKFEEKQEDNDTAVEVKVNKEVQKDETAQAEENNMEIITKPAELITMDEEVAPDPEATSETETIKPQKTEQNSQEHELNKEQEIKNEEKETQDQQIPEEKVAEIPEEIVAHTSEVTVAHTSEVTVAETPEEHS